MYLWTVVEEVSFPGPFKEGWWIMTGQSLEFWTRLLRLPGFVAVHVEEASDQGRFYFTVAPEQRIGVCPHCQRASEKVHQTRTRESINADFRGAKPGDNFIPPKEVMGTRR